MAMGVPITAAALLETMLVSTAMAPIRAAMRIGGGGTLKLSDLRGKTVVLYFYPKDDTPG